MAPAPLRLLLALLTAAVLAPGVAGLALASAVAEAPVKAAVDADAAIPCTNSVDCYVSCVLGNPTAPLIYYQCLTWDFLPRIRCYLDPNHDHVCPTPLDPPYDG